MAPDASHITQADLSIRWSSVLRPTAETYHLSEELFVCCPKGLLAQAYLPKPRLALVFMPTYDHKNAMNSGGKQMLMRRYTAKAKRVWERSISITGL